MPGWSRGDRAGAAAHKIGVGEPPYLADTPILASNRTDDDAWQDADVVGGTAFHFCKPAFEGAFNTLFVDEAGQVGLATLLAMGRCARNIVLVGDPRQLPQVVQGAHPGDAGLSCLDWLIGDHATVTPDRGILLKTTWRIRRLADATRAGAGRATPVILDDALVYADEARFAAVLEAVATVASDVQVIVLTCRERAFSTIPANRAILSLAGEEAAAAL